MDAIKSDTFLTGRMAVQEKQTKKKRKAVIVETADNTEPDVVV